MSAPSRRRPPGRRADPGQTLVLFALASLVLLGALGLAIDGGYVYLQRRAMQNAADAAALAGASAIARDRTDAQVLQAVRDAAARNGVADPGNVTCTLITNAYGAAATGATQECSANGWAMSSFATNFTGVLVRTTERHETFVFRALGITQSGASATAAARVERPIGITGGPFMVCGIDTVVTVGASDAFYLGGIYETSGHYPTKLDAKGKPTAERVDGFADCSGGLCKKVASLPGGAPAVHPQAYAYEGAGLVPIRQGGKGGPTYAIHSPNNLSVCNNNSASFKGINTEGNVYDSQWYRAYNDAGFNTAPGYRWPPLTTGTVASIEATVNGINGCQAGGVADNCVMILPVADASGPGGTGDNAILAVRSLEAFYVRQTSSNAHTGQLIRGYTIRANSDPTHVAGSAGVTVVKLIR